MDDSPLQKVELQTDVYMVCLQHALSTENFEVMGLLIGNVCGIYNILCSYARYFFIISYTIDEPIEVLIISLLVCLWSSKNISCYYFTTSR